MISEAVKWVFLNAEGKYSSHGEQSGLRLPVRSIHRDCSCIVLAAQNLAINGAAGQGVTSSFFCKSNTPRLREHPPSACFARFRAQVRSGALVESEGARHHRHCADKRARPLVNEHSKGRTEGAVRAGERRGTVAACTEGVAVRTCHFRRHV
jgi:hypothetical protein